MKKFLSGIWSQIKSDVKTGNSDFRWMFLKCAILGLLLFVSIFVPFFVVIIFVVTAVFIIMQKNGRSIYFILFLFPLRSIFTLPNVSFSWAFSLSSLMIIYCIKFGIVFLYQIIKRQKSINIPFTIVCLVLIIYIMLPIGTHSFNSSLWFASGIALLYLAFVFRKDLSFKEMAFVFILALLFSTAIGLFRPLSSHMQELLPPNH